MFWQLSIESFGLETVTGAFRNVKCERDNVLRIWPHMLEIGEMCPGCVELCCGAQI